MLGKASLVLASADEAMVIEGGQARRGWLLSLSVPPAPTPLLPREGAMEAR